MPVRSLNSSVLVWPDVKAVDAAARQWAKQQSLEHQEMLRAGYFGSYARGDWGVGSDLDLIVLVGRSEAPFERRAAFWDATGLPVPADVLVYTTAEWEALTSSSPFAETVAREAVWVYER